MGRDFKEERVVDAIGNLKFSTARDLGADPFRLKFRQSRIS